MQKRVFEEQIRLSLDLEMPLIVHDREAHGDVYDLLRKYKPNALVHCFSGSVELMREAVRMGMYISLGGVVTFKNAVTAWRSPRKFRLTGFCLKPMLRIWRPCRSVASVATAL